MLISLPVGTVVCRKALGIPAFVRRYGRTIGMGKVQPECSDAAPPGADVILRQEPDEEEEEDEGDSEEDDEEDDTDDGYSE